MTAKLSHKRDFTLTDRIYKNSGNNLLLSGIHTRLIKKKFCLYWETEQ